MIVVPDDEQILFELADAVHGIARQLRVPDDLVPGPCTPIEITVMRYVQQNPGVSASDAAAATGLPTSNLSRSLRSLESKGLVRRDADIKDGRGILLYPTALADINIGKIRQAWTDRLIQATDSEYFLKEVVVLLKKIEHALSLGPQT
ncbi:MarR family transcriptional regulator [Sphingomonas ginsenosidivorax]|uniref:MarR family transcriptional regulator n=1 Tax=Sphingomonas ginsenosidivorax TaxID=862135 RepID=A0A5C6U8P1_9SPHN|nr:helix-turn-helix domain-containing protein [Sphingomonas ginsenosidivorax]TXC67988.1 MarR family transcriptional regulator [Sphingomonas ginsenosidivorax]